MCTVILGVELPEAEIIVLGANRDEDPARPSELPRILVESPRVAGGRDARAGGTWLAVRERRGAVALLNRRPVAPAPPAPARRSRGLLALEVASAPMTQGDTFASAARRVAERAFARDAYAPCTLLLASPSGCWAASLRAGSAVEFRTLAPGWHVITHEDVDDRTEPRARWLLDDLAGFAPATTEAAIDGIAARLRLHAGDRDGPPDVCIHAGRMVTVSSATLVLGPGIARYRHVEGPACTGVMHDVSALLGPDAPRRGAL